jgi:hypothetical protein
MPNGLLSKITYEFICGLFIFLDNPYGSGNSCGIIIKDMQEKFGESH